jgi:hypothetical protein
VTRWTAAVLGGCAYLVAVAWLNVWTSVALSAGAVAIVAVLRLSRANVLRGLWASPSGDRAELGFPAVATIALAVGWGMLGQPRLAFVAIAFMTWGDATAGLVRGLLDRGPLQQAGPPVAMLAACIGSAWLFYPLPSALPAAVIATAAEALWPLTRSRLSDSWPVVGSALGLMSMCGGISQQ